MLEAFMRRISQTDKAKQRLNIQGPIASTHKHTTHTPPTNANIFLIQNKWNHLVVTEETKSGVSTVAIAKKQKYNSDL